MQQPPTRYAAWPDSPQVGGDADDRERRASLTRQLVAALTLLLLGVAWQVVEAPGVATALRFLHETGHETGQTWLPTIGSWAMMCAFSVLAAVLGRRRVPLLVGLTAAVAAAAVLQVTQPIAGSFTPSIALAAGTALALCLPPLAPRWQVTRWALVVLCWPAGQLVDLGLPPGRGQILLMLVMAGTAGLLPALAEQLASRRATPASG
jgi:hypothetical protein